MLEYGSVFEPPFYLICQISHFMGPSKDGMEHLLGPNLGLSLV